jgi:hypothetical protein
LFLKKERDLELAATIGKQLLEKDQQLESKIEFLELELEKTGEMVNQLRYEINLKDNLLKTFIDSEYDEYISDKDQTSDDLESRKVTFVNQGLLNEYKKKIEYLENENDILKSKADCYELQNFNLQIKEAELIKNSAREYG